MRADFACGPLVRVLASSPIGVRSWFAAGLLLFGLLSNTLCAQNGTGQATETTEQRVEHLTAVVAQAQAQMEAYQKQLLEMQAELAALHLQMAAEKAAGQPAVAAAPSAHPEAGTQSALDEIRERQAIEESQIATHEATKVETESKFPLKVSGLVLLNGFVNTRQVDVPASPSYAISGSGSTGLSLRQTVLGLDARGPHLWGATSHADLRVDFFANGGQSSYAASGVLRLRTAHAALNWQDTSAFIELDRSLLEPNEPSSLVSIAQPELAWAGNLWNWNPQIGISHQFPLTDSARIQVQGALIDTFDPQPPGSTATAPAVTQTERSRWPGTEARIAFLQGKSGSGPEIGIGGYFSPHVNDDGDRFDAWAASVDSSLPLSKFFELSANAYRGAALAGLGGGGYINYLYRGAGLTPAAYALDDVGGWAQLKARPSERVELNAGYGIDNPFAKEIRASMSSLGTNYYSGLVRNRAFFSNVIYSPSAYLLFSLEYRRFWTNYYDAQVDSSDSIGIGAGYRF